jgi:hypothetical protein
MICDIQTRNPYPPTTPTATMGQMPKARTRKVSSSRRRVAAVVSVERSGLYRWANARPFFEQGAQTIADLETAATMW